MMEGSESVTAKIEFWRLIKATAEANLLTRHTTACSLALSLKSGSGGES